jgi:hypothetical protein
MYDVISTPSLGDVPLFDCHAGTTLKWSGGSSLASRSLSSCSATSLARCSV